MAREHYALTVLPSSGTLSSIVLDFFVAEVCSSSDKLLDLPLA